MRRPRPRSGTGYKAISRLLWANIGSSALIKVRFTRILARTDDNAWVEVLIEDVIPVGEICDRFPAQTIDDKERLPDWDMFSEHPDCTQGEFSLYSWNAQSDVGGWYLVQTVGSRKHIILYDEWSFHYDNVYCGNIV